MESCYEVVVHSGVHISDGGRSSNGGETTPLIPDEQPKIAYLFSCFARVQLPKVNIIISSCRQRPITSYQCYPGAIGSQALWLELVIAAACKIF